MKKKFLAGMVIGLMFFGMAHTANAVLIQFGERTVFSSEGSIVENYGYEDFGTDFSFPGDPWTAHGVTYTTGDNLIVGTDTVYNPISNVFAYDSWSPLTADIDTTPQYDMFGLDIGYLGSLSVITFEIETNLSSYSFTLDSPSLASQNLDFFGFTASANEYFTGFSLTSSQGNGSAPVIDNVTLGQTTAPVPEPTTVLLLGFGLAGLVGTRVRKKKK